MAWTLIASGQAQGDVDPGPVETGSFNTTGADLIVGFTSVESTFATTNTFGDNKSNSYTGKTIRTTGQAAIQPYYFLSPTVGSGHKFNATGRRPALQFQAWSSGGSPSFTSEQGNATIGAATISTGLVVIDIGDLVVAACNAGTSARTVTGVVSNQDAGRSITLDQVVVGAFFGGASAYFQESVSGFENLVFTYNDSDTYLVAALMVFSVSGGGGGGGKPITYYDMMRRQ